MRALFNVNINKVGVMLLPITLRSPLMMAFLKAAISPIQQLHVQFVLHREQVTYTLGHNSQVCYLQKVLNDAIDPAKRRVSVGFVERKEYVPFYQEKDKKPVVFNKDFMGSPCFYNESTIAENKGDFYISIPSELKTEINEIRIKNLANKYKLASKRYIII